MKKFIIKQSFGMYIIHLLNMEANLDTNEIDMFIYFCISN